MDDAIRLDQKYLYALRRSILYINVCKKSLFKGIRSIYLLAFVLDPLFTQISGVVFCLLYEKAAKTGVLRFYSRISSGTSHNYMKDNSCQISSQFAYGIQNYATWQNPNC